MSATIRPHTKLAAALIAAGMMSAVSFPSVANAPRSVPTVTADVAYTSAVTDLLRDAGQGVEVFNSLVGIHVDATISVPFEATLAIMAAAQHPELSANVLSFLVQRFVNPSVGDPIHAYPYDTELTVARLADLLPYPLGPSATQPGLILDGGVEFAALFDSVLGQLADPLPGYEAVKDVMNNTVLGGAVVAAHLATRAPMNMIWNGANYVGYLPANLEATLESALARPDQIPGLISNLVYGLLSPDPQVGLFGKLLNNAVDPFTWLPAPIGYTSDAMTGLANQTRDLIAGVMNAVLAALPAPVAPSALPSGAGAELGPRGGLSAGKGDYEKPTASIAAVEEQDTGTVENSANGPDTAKPVKSERLRHEVVNDPLTKTEPTNDDTIKSDTIKSDTIKSDTIKSDTIKSDPIKADPIKAEPKAPKTPEPENAEPKKTESDNSESTNTAPKHPKPHRRLHEHADSDASGPGDADSAKAPAAASA